MRQNGSAAYNTGDLRRLTTIPNDEEHGNSEAHHHRHYDHNVVCEMRHDSLLTDREGKACDVFVIVAYRNQSNELTGIIEVVFHADRSGRIDLGREVGDGYGIEIVLRSSILNDAYFDGERPNLMFDIIKHQDRISNSRKFLAKFSVIEGVR